MCGCEVGDWLFILKWFSVYKNIFATTNGVQIWSWWICEFKEVYYLFVPLFIHSSSVTALSWSGSWCVLGTFCVRQGCTLNGMPVNQKAPCIDTFTHSFTHRAVLCSQSTFLGGGRKLENPCTKSMYMGWYCLTPYRQWTRPKDQTVELWGTEEMRGSFSKTGQLEAQRAVMFLKT